MWLRPYCFLLCIVPATRAKTCTSLIILVPQTVAVTSCSVLACWTCRWPLASVNFYHIIDVGLCSGIGNPYLPKKDVYMPLPAICKFLPSQVKVKHVTFIQRHHK